MSKAFKYDHVKFAVDGKLVEPIRGRTAMTMYTDDIADLADFKEMPAPLSYRMKLEPMKLEPMEDAIRKLRGLPPKDIHKELTKLLGENVEKAMRGAPVPVSLLMPPVMPGTSAGIASALKLACNTFGAAVNVQVCEGVGCAVVIAIITLDAEDEHMIEAHESMLQAVMDSTRPTAVEGLIHYRINDIL